MIKSLAAFTILFIIFPAIVHSDVIVYDTIVPPGREVMLKAKVKGRFFSKGGEIVEFSVDGRSIGKSLSGGDGLAFKPFTPLKAGIYHITAKSGNDEGKGLLRSLKKGSKIVFVDVADGLFEKLSHRPRHGSQKVIKELCNRFPVVLMQRGLLDVRSIKKWLKENEFVELPVVPWSNGMVFDEVVEEGFKIKAVIGSQEVIDSAREYNPLAFSFEEVEDAEYVSDWEEIRKKLR